MCRISYYIMSVLTIDPYMVISARAGGICMCSDQLLHNECLDHRPIYGILCTCGRRLCVRISYYIMIVLTIDPYMVFSARAGGICMFGSVTT